MQNMENRFLCFPICKLKAQDEREKYLFVDEKDPHGGFLGRLSLTSASSSVLVSPVASAPSS